MAVVDIAILALLGTALVFSIIELGMTAYIVHAYNEVDDITNDYGYYYYYPRSQVNFLLFCSIWGILVSAALLVVPFVMRSGGKVLGFGTLVVNTITMIFWLAGFAAFAAYFSGLISIVGIAGAILAFAIMVWLIFLALTVINFLTAFGVLQSGRAGHENVFGGRSRGPMTTSAPSNNMSSV